MGLAQEISLPQGAATALTVPFLIYQPAALQSKNAHPQIGKLGMQQYNGCLLQRSTTVGMLESTLLLQASRKQQVWDYMKKDKRQLEKVLGKGPKKEKAKRPSPSERQANNKLLPTTSR